MHKIELICYAGSLACLKAALNSGADSVYVGGESFGRDTLSQEFSREDLIEGIKFAHENNKKVYVYIGDTDLLLTGQTLSDKKENFTTLEHKLGKDNKTYNFTLNK